MSDLLLRKILSQLWDERLNSLEEQFGDLSSLSNQGFAQDVALKALSELETYMVTRDAWLRYMPSWAYGYGTTLPAGKKVPKCSCQDWLGCYLRLTFYSKAAHGMEPENIPPQEKEGGITEIINFLGKLMDEQKTPPAGWTL